MQQTTSLCKNWVDLINFLFLKNSNYFLTPLKSHFIKANNLFLFSNLSTSNLYCINMDRNLKLKMIQNILNLFLHVNLGI